MRLFREVAVKPSYWSDARPKKRRDPHVAIVEAAKRGTGVHFTAEEVAYLAEDAAIVTRAALVSHPSGEE